MAWSTSSLGLLLLLATGSPELRRFEAAEPHMGTIFRIVLYAEDAGKARDGFAKAFERVRRLDATFSDYNDASESMRVGREACAGPVKVGPDLFTVLQVAQRLSEETGGAFDVTVGSLTHLWRTARREHRLPPPEEIGRAGGTSGFRKLTLDPVRRTVEIRQCGLVLDFGAIAKGYAADEALRELKGLGIPRALVAASGDVAMGAAPPGAKGWRVALESPNDSLDAFASTLELAHAAVSTSGDTEQFLDLDGQRYSHILDGRTGRPLTGSIVVTVIANSGMEADSLATAVSVLGPDEGMRLIEKREGTASLIVTPAGTRRSSRVPGLTNR